MPGIEGWHPFGPAEATRGRRPPAITRRGFVQAGLAASATWLVAACSNTAAPAAAPTTAPVTKPTAAPAATAVANSPSPAASPAAAVPSAAPAAAASPGAVGAGTAAGAAGSAAAITPLSPAVKLRLALSGTNISYLPIFLAVDKGYFAKAGVDLDVAKFNGSSSTQLPLLARGDLDIGPVTPTPAFFNQAAQGFDVKIIASNGVEKVGRVSNTWLMVQGDEASQIRQLTDLKGKTIDGAAEGTPISLLALEAIRQAGLTPGVDVTLSFKAKTPPDMLALAKAKGADVIGMVEPTATQSIQEAQMVRWKGFADLAPWYSPAQLAASKPYLDKNPQAVEKFLEVYLAACREVNATNGVWSDELVNEAATWGQVAPAVITAQGGVPYFDPNGSIAVDTLSRAQDFWLEQKQVKDKVDVQQTVNLQPLQEAVTRLGRVS